MLMAFICKRPAAEVLVPSRMPPKVPGTNRKRCVFVYRTKTLFFEFVFQSKRPV